MRWITTTTTCAALAAALSAQNRWALITPTTSPQMQRNGAMGFDSVNNRLLMFGGLTQTPGSIVADTWSYNGQWTLLSSVSSPARWGHRLVRSPVANRLVMFGGRSPDISPLANDTWEWTGSAWSVVPTPTAPSARHLYGMAHDSTRNVVVLFGGRNYTATLNDTWEYNGITWAQRSAATPPPARAEMVFVDDPATGGTLLFGGTDPATGAILGDTWTWNGVDWTERTPAVSPSPRYRAAAIADSVRRRPVVYGGYTGTAFSNETFEWDGASWYIVPAGTVAPPNSTESYHGYDPVRRKFVVFGGWTGAAFTNATYEYTGVNNGLFSTYGDSCDTPQGEPTIAANSAPTTGQTLTLTFGNVPTDTELVLAVFGFSRTTWNGLPLSFDLAPIGLPGCGLLAAADVIDILATSGGSAAYSLAIPNQAALVNVQLFTQGILLDLLPVDFVFTGATRGGRIVIGN